MRIPAASASLEAPTNRLSQLSSGGSTRHGSAGSFAPRTPDGRSRGSLSQTIREHLCRSGGCSTRQAIRDELNSNARLRQRLGEGQGLERLLRNMQFSGFLTIDGEDVRATVKTLRRTAI